MTWCS